MTDYMDTTDRRSTERKSDYSEPLMGTAGEADIMIDVDEETYQRLHDAYTAAVDRGYTEGFRLFLLNHVDHDDTFTVDDDPLPESE